jgi:hypothetical protein
MATTTNYGWTTPDDTALVKDGAAAIRTLGSSVDTTTKALNPSTTLGDIEYRSSTANTNTRLGIGTTGQVLTVAGGVPSWATVAGGGMTLISTTNLTGSEVSLTSIPATYNELLVIIRNPELSGEGQIRARFNADTTSGRYTTNNNTNTSQMAGSTNSFGNDLMSLSNLQDATDNQGFVYWQIPDYANTTTWKMTFNYTMTNDTTTGTSWKMWNGFNAYNQTGAISSIQVFVDSGTFTAGTILLYGVK